MCQAVAIPCFSLRSSFTERRWPCIDKFDPNDTRVNLNFARGSWDLVKGHGIVCTTHQWGIELAQQIVPARAFAVEKWADLE